MYLWGYRSSDPVHPSLVRGLDPSAKVVWHKKAHGQDPMCRSVGPVPFGAAPFHADCSDPETVFTGCQHRQAAKVPNMSRAVRRKLRAFTHTYLRKHLRPLRISDVPDFDSWLKNSTQYTEEQKKVLAAAREESEKYPYGKLPKRYRKGKCFPKREKHQEPKCSRGICGRHPVVRSRYGPIFHAIEEAIYALPFFVKGLTPQQRIKVLADELSRSGVLLDNDFSCFEGSFSVALMSAVEKVVIDYLLAAFPKQLRKEIWLDMKTSVFRYKHFTVTVDGKRKSGDAWTSVFNGFTNAILIMFAAAESGLRPTDLVFKVEGDDSSILLLVRKRFEFSRIVLDAGFLAKEVWYDHISDGNFCQLTFDPDSLVLIKDAAKVIVSFPWLLGQHLDVTEEHADMLYRAKAMSLASECGSTPILSVFAGTVLRRTSRVEMDWQFVTKHTPYYMRSKIEYSDRVSEPPLSARVAYSGRYGISVDEQLVIEDCIRKTGTVTPPLLHRFVHPRSYEAWAYVSPSRH